MYYIESVIMSIIDRLLEYDVEKEEEDEDYDNGVYGYNIIPIAALFGGNFLCLDYRESTNNSTICVWDHEMSDDGKPVTYFIANSFKEFLKLYKY